MLFVNGVKNIQAAAYNGARTVYIYIYIYIYIYVTFESDFIMVLITLCTVPARESLALKNKT